MLLSLQQVAERSGFAVPTLRAWARRGVLPIIKLGGRVRVDAADFERLVDAGRVHRRPPVALEDARACED